MKTTCSSCGASISLPVISLKSPTCASCGAGLLPKPAEENAKDDTSFKRLIGRSIFAFAKRTIIGVLLVGLVLVLILLSSENSTRNPASSEKSSSIQVADTKSIRVCAKCKKSLAVFREKAALDEFLNAMDADDNQRLLALYSSGRHFEVPENTKVKVVDTGLFRNKLEVYKISVQEGAYAGSTGWVMDIDLK